MQILSDVVLNCPVTAELIKKRRPDAVIIATGSREARVGVPPTGGPFVVSARHVLDGKCSVGDKVVIFGGGLVGCETAELLVQKGKRVTVLSMRPKLMSGDGVPFHIRELLLARLAAKGVATLAGLRQRKVVKDGVAVTTSDGLQHTIAADTVVMATGSEPEADLYWQLQGKMPQVFIAGDALEPRGIIDAVIEGFRAGNSV